MCVSTFTTKNNDVVPCGRCSECRKRKISGWAFRLEQQNKISLNSYFVTLTYDTDHVPITDRGFMSLKKRDVQLFIKRLRKSQRGYFKTKYYAVGEYGSKTRRPHYHVIFFDIKPELVQNAWGLGYTRCDPVNLATIQYVLKYVSKPYSVKHSNDDRIREFSLCSKGLGLNYLTQAMIEYHKADPANRACMVKNDGKKVAMPRYYKDKIFTHQEKMQIAEKGLKDAQDKMKKQVEYYYKQVGDKVYQKIEEIKRHREELYFKNTKEKRSKL